MYIVYLSKISQIKNENLLLASEIFEVSVGCILGDSSIIKRGKQPYLKFEQGYKHKEYLFHLYSIFKLYCSSGPKIRYNKNGAIKSYYFRTVAHIAFLELHDQFIVNTKKTVCHNTVKLHLSARGLAYWIMDDGSLQTNKKAITQHTQGFSKAEISILSNELNNKFGLDSRVNKDGIYYIIYIPAKDSMIIQKLIKPFFHLSMVYKQPKHL